MKKILSLLAVGIISLACVSTANAATAVNLNAQKKANTTIEQKSSLYNMQIEMDNGSRVQTFNYLYSSNILFSEGFLNYLNQNYPGISSLAPTVANELAIAYFKGIVSGDVQQLYNGKGSYEYAGWFYGGVEDLDAFTISYWDDIVNVANNTNICPGRTLQIKTTSGVILAEYTGGQFGLDNNIIKRYEDRISKYYQQNKKTYTNESYSSDVKYGYADGELTVLTQEIINKENVDVYDIDLVKYSSPLVLNIKGDGKLEASNGNHLPHRTVDYANTVITDFYGDGFEIAMEWVGPNDGLLVEPKADGTVDMTCLFGTNDGFDDGYEKLSLYADRNGNVTGENLAKLAVWQDANGNAKADKGEVKTCAELGITSISVNHKNFVSSFTMNGKTQKMWDWFPTAAELIKLASK